MKHAPSIVAAAALTLIVAWATPARSQTAPISTSRPNQTLSHQMNQPTPKPSKRYELSQKTVDEIADLYLAAKKELEAKSGAAKGRK